MSTTKSLFIHLKQAMYHSKCEPLMMVKGRWFFSFLNLLL